jgi:nuclear GTP-binding protein
MIYFHSSSRQMQTVKLDKLIKLFDSPGIVMSKEVNPANLVLRNCIRVCKIIE